MPNLLSLSKHVEFEWNLALQIINQKERWSRRRAEKEVEQWGVKFRTTMRKFFNGAKFRTSAIFSPAFLTFSFFYPFSHFFLLV